MRNKEDYIFFWSGVDYNDTIGPWVFSQWANLPIVQNNITFKTAEHYMMFSKALLFEGPHSLSAREILISDTPKDAKSLGRNVKGFNDEIWNTHCDAIVYRANLLKFSQNINLISYILSTDELELVEASPYDKIWGIGYDVNDSNLLTGEWGQNKLGKALMRVRTVLKQIY